MIHSTHILYISAASMYSDAHPPRLACCTQIWPRVHNQVMFCLVLAQLVLVFILAIKKVSWRQGCRCNTLLCSFVLPQM